MPQEHRPVRSPASAPRAPEAPGQPPPGGASGRLAIRRFGRRVPGWLGGLVVAGAAGLVLGYGAARPPGAPAAVPAGAAPAAPAVLVAGAALGGDPLAPAPGDATPRVVAAADAFLASLDDAQRAQAVFAFDDTTAKTQWSNLPRGLFGWVGVRTGDLSEAQQQTVLDLLRVTLGPLGYQRVLESVAADEVLKSESGSNPLLFGAENYFVAVFGAPSTTAPWMFRFGGHHITVNATVVGPNIAATPSFPGCQPCAYALDGATGRPVGPVADRAFALLNAPDASLLPPFPSPRFSLSNTGDPLAAGRRNADSAWLARGQCAWAGAGREPTLASFRGRGRPRASGRQGEPR